MSKKEGFVLMPFCQPFNKYYKEIYKPALENCGYQVKRADESAKPGPIISDIQRAIWESDLILCEMTKHNPNVFYELGLAHAIGKPVILISHEGEEIPFDFKHIRIIMYNDKNNRWKPELREKIMKATIDIEGAEDVYTGSMETYSAKSSKIRPDDSSHDVGSRMLPAFFPPLLKLFRMKHKEIVEIIIPSYENIRQNYPEFSNYPMHLFESAFDDVYCTFRILPTLELYSGLQNVYCHFDQEISKAKLMTCSNLILIGSSVSNRYTRYYLELANAYFRFGEHGTVEDHDIVDHSGNNCFGAKKSPLHVSMGTQKFYYEKDYALLSAFRLPIPGKSTERRIVILAGCRAFSQVGLGDLLANNDFVKILANAIPIGDYQCVVDFDIYGREPSFNNIKEIWHREDKDHNWKKVNIKNLNEIIFKKFSSL